jgi:hypothetical protein
VSVAVEPTYRVPDILQLIPGVSYVALDQMIRRYGVTDTDHKRKRGQHCRFTAHVVACLRLECLLVEGYGIQLGAGSGHRPDWLWDAAELIRALPLKALAGRYLIATEGDVWFIDLDDLPGRLAGATCLLTVIPCDQLIEGLI